MKTLSLLPLCPPWVHSHQLLHTLGTSMAGKCLSSKSHSHFALEKRVNTTFYSSLQSPCPFAFPSSCSMKSLWFKSHPTQRIKPIIYTFRHGLNSESSAINGFKGICSSNTTCSSHSGPQCTNPTQPVPTHLLMPVQLITDAIADESR